MKIIQFFPIITIKDGYNDFISIVIMIYDFISVHHIIFMCYKAEKYINVLIKCYF